MAVVYPGLTTFRFLAFCVVFFFHQSLLPVGYLSLQSFFVLSGFLITEILVNMKASYQDKHYFLAFYGRRILRIFPLYYFYLLLVTIIAAPWFFPEWRSDIPVINRFYQQLGWAASYTYNFFHASDSFKHTFLLTHFWSLAIEEQFYLLWPIFIFLLPTARLKIFLLGVIISGPLLRWLTGEVVKAGALPWLGSEAGLVVYVLPFSHFDAFAIGGFYALYGKSCSARTIGLMLAGILAFGIATSVLFESHTDWWGLGYSNFMERSYKYVWGYSLFNWCFALMLINIRDCQQNNRWLNARWMVYLGSISYGLYIFHNGFIWLVNATMPGQWFLLRFILAFALTVLASAMCYRFIEQPCLGLKDRFFPTASRKPRL
jgi:peptidoglycan/LPS O-acetylase OafA/YrhL